MTFLIANVFFNNLKLDISSHSTELEYAQYYKFLPDGLCRNLECSTLTVRQTRGVDLSQ